MCVVSLRLKQNKTGGPAEIPGEATKLSDFEQVAVLAVVGWAK